MSGLTPTRTVFHFTAQLYLELQYVHDAEASELETMDINNAHVIDFCNAVQTQISGSIVEATAAAYNSTIIGTDGLDCIQGTNRIHDPEAVDLFGDGYFSLQIHVSQQVVIESSNLLWLELVETIAETGFTRKSGGAQQFRSSLQSNRLFSTVISVDVRRGLSAPALPLARYPTFSPTITPTHSPSMQPSPVASDSPSVGPSASPSFAPSAAPSMPPSATPSHMPLSKLTIAPSTLHLIDPTLLGPSTIPATVQKSTPSGISNQTFDVPVIAAIVGAGVMLLTAFVLALLLLLRCRSKQKKRRAFPNEVALSKRDIHGRQVIPIVVELSDDIESLADTSIGEYTAGGGREPTRRGFSRKSLRPLGSFDENSLYTTPFSVKLEQEDSLSLSTPQASEYPLETPRIDWNLDRDDLPRLSNSNGASTREHEKSHSSSKTADALRSSVPSIRRSIPVDVDSGSPYYDDSLRISKIEPLDKGLSTVQESDAFSQGINSDFDDEFTRDASELDVWSYNFDEFNRDSDSSLEDEVVSNTSTAQVASNRYMDSSNSRILGDSSDSHSSFDVLDSASMQPSPKEEDVSSAAKPTEEKCVGSFHLSIKEAGQKILGDLLKQADPPPPFQSPKSTESSKTSNSSFSSRKAYTGSKEYRLDPSIRRSESLRSREPLKPMTKLLQSLSIPPHTREGNESDLSDILDAGDASTAEIENGHHVFEEDDESGMSTSPWLMGETEKVLGPRSLNADTESLSGKSSRSLHSKRTRGRKAGSETSFGSGSRFSAHHVSSVMSAVSSSMSADILEQTGGEIAVKASKEALKNDKKRLEAQLAQITALENDLATTTSSVTLTTIPGASLSTLSHQSRSNARRKNRKKKIVVLAPPGKLGVILANRHDGKGTVVAELRPGSPLEGMLSPGDKLVAVDSRNVEHLDCSQITSLIAASADHDRCLTVVTEAG
ncbi:hypothetical protein IV203_032044 [Nitzschia inconspicua]|uniref:Circumsporozoite protein n=1 Tax=Nitzschia inconspicua TaxID=303405 RepID=A0A9K3LZ75_9STRA|nr:hypothetical protein IV203_032044 [Nitzschia inconspicua]